MKYILYILLIAVIFGLYALVDFLFKKLFARSKTEQSGQAVRLPRYSPILGLLIALLGLIALLFLPGEGQWALRAGCAVVLVMGLFLLVNFFRFGIFYDDNCFVCRSLTKKAKTYYYKDITGQRSFLARSGVNISLYVDGDEIQLYSAMQGLDSFLNKAFYSWCQAKGIDPDTVENNPHMLTFFPEPDESFLPPQA